MATPGVTSSFSGSVWTWRGALIGVLFLPAMCGVVWGLSQIGDQTHAATHAAESQSKETVMVCMGGVIDYGDPASTPG